MRRFNWYEKDNIPWYEKDYLVQKRLREKIPGTKKITGKNTWYEKDYGKN
jgi:hypothetical protein